MSKHILVVEDDELIRELLQITLELEGYSVEVANNGRVALDSIAERRPDVAVVDLAMPEMGGLELLDVIGTSAEVPPGVVVVSGNVTPQIEQKARAAGANVVLKKPVGRDEVLGAIETALADTES